MGKQCQELLTYFLTLSMSNLRFSNLSSLSSTCNPDSCRAVRTVLLTITFVLT